MARKAPSKQKAAPKKKAPAKKAPVKTKAAKKKAPAKKKRPGRGASSSAPKPASVRADEKKTRSTTPAKKTMKKAAKKKAAPKKAPPTPRPRKPVFHDTLRLRDGASARRASQSFTDEVTPGISVGAGASTFTGPGLDQGAGDSPAGGLFDDMRPGRGSEGALSSPRDRAFLDQLADLLSGGGMRQMLADFLMRDRSEQVDDFGMDLMFADRWRPLFEFLYRHWWRVETIGMDNVPDTGGALIVANHSGTLPYDGAMIMYAVRYDHPAHRDVRPLVEDFIFHFPFLGVFLNRVGCVRACQDNAERLLRQGQVAAVFPEGVQGIGKLYRHRYQLQRFGRGGFIRLAFKTGTPIIPAAVVGAEEIHPMMAKGTWMTKPLGIPYMPMTPTFPWLGPLGAIPFPSKWHIRFGEPIDLKSQYGANGGDDRLLVGRLTEQVRSNIQGMVDDCLARRGSVVFG